jgi:regulatory protein
LKKQIANEDIRLKIMNLLSRREHSEKEIYMKLIKFVESKTRLNDEIEKLKNEGLLSDARFSEAYMRSRFNSGFGPVRIKYELSKKGVNKIFIDRALIETDLDWDKKMIEEYEKKYDSNKTKDQNFLKISKFLLYRGFDLEKISKLRK